MNKIHFMKRILFPSFTISIIICITQAFQLYLNISEKSAFLHIGLSAICIAMILCNLFIFHLRLKKELGFLNKSIQQMIEHNFSRKFKMHKFPVDDEIGMIYNEVTKVLDKVHQRTSELQLHRKELNETGKNIEILSSIGKKILSKLDLSQIILTTFNSINRLFEAYFMEIGIYNRIKKGIDLYGIRSGTKDIVTGFDNMNDAFSWRVYCFNSQFEIMKDHNNPESEYHFSNILFNEQKETRESFIYVPMNNLGKQIGILSIQSFKPHTYNTYHLGFIKNLANYVSIAILNAEAFKQIELQKNEIELSSEKLKKAHNELEFKITLRTKELSIRNNEIEAKNIELERLSLVARKTDNAIMIMDSEGNIQWINECFTRIYNYALSDFIKARGSNLVQTSFNPDIKNTLLKCKQTKKSVFYEAYNITADGKGIWTQTTLTPVLDINCNITHLLTIDSDITQLKEYELKITQQAHEITKSIQYASKIQKAILPPRDIFKYNLKDYLLFHKPKDIVSGDFYWIDRRNNNVLVALADCTGHGVPGAFMSILGISLLNEIFQSNKTNCPDEILNNLRYEIKRTLRQNQNKNELTDGMDISLCMIDLNEKKVKFSGANNSLFIIRNNEIVELKGDKIPIGIHINDKNLFTRKEIEIEANDLFYMATDGYFDQFGGENNKKFMSHRFKNLLLDMHRLSFKEQKKILDTTIKQWQGNCCDQIDDISVLGFCV
jgi:PAS domain S-box-containing protein